MKKIPLICAFLSVCISCDGLRAAELFGISDLVGGSFNSQINAVNADGTVFVGTGVSGRGSEAFVWTRTGGFQGLGGLPGSGACFGNGVSANGDFVVGHCTVSASGNTPFIWSKANGMVALPRLPGATQAIAEDVSADGTVVVGGSSSSNSTLGNQEPARWDLGVVSAIGDLPGGSVQGSATAVSDDGKVMSGYSYSVGGWETFRWSENTGLQGLIDLRGNPLSVSSFAFGMSATGEYIVGGAQTADGFVEGFYWNEDQGMQGIGRFATSPYRNYADGISSDGGIIVGNNDDRAFIWTREYGLMDLKQALQMRYGVDVSGWGGLTATDISDDGTTIVGYGRRSGGFALEGFVAVIPEPTVFSYLCFSVLTVAFPRRPGRLTAGAINGKEAASNGAVKSRVGL